MYFTELDELLVSIFCSIIFETSPKDDVFRVTFKNRSSAEINILAKFFDNFAAKAFPFTVNDFDGETQMKVTCEDYSVAYIQTTVHSLSATFKRVYEP